MSIAAHPTYAKARNRLVRRLRASVGESPRPQPFVFLCGKNNSDVRPLIRQYLNRHHPDLLVFYAETVWDHVKDLSIQNALAMEAELGRLADALVIVVESPGTFAELGAFSISAELRAKLLIVLDERYKKDQSFINTGPIKWINTDSRFAPCLYCSFDSFGPSLGLIGKKLEEIPKTGRFSLKEWSRPAEEKPKHLLLLICDLVTLIGPATREEIISLYSEMLSSEPLWDANALLGLAVSLRFLRSYEKDNDTFYYRPLEEGVLSGFLPLKRFDINQERARFIQAYQRMPHVWNSRFPMVTTNA